MVMRSDIMCHLTRIIIFNLKSSNMHPQPPTYITELYEKMKLMTKFGKKMKNNEILRKNEKMKK